MFPAAKRLITFGAVISIAAVCAHAARAAAGSAEKTPADKAAPAPASRVAPSRPIALKPLPAVKIGGIEYVNLADGAPRLGLEVKWIEPARKLALVDKTVRAEIEADSREAAVNGQRVFFGSPALTRGGHLLVSQIDFERCLTPLLRPGFGVILPATPKIIVLDPGHGGVDNGTENKTLGLKEKTFTLAVALKLKPLLEAAGYKVVMIRNDDRPLSANKILDLSLRPDFANRAGADLFISIHFNAVENDMQTTRGTEVYTYAPKSQHATAWWSEMKKDDPDVETSDQPANRFDHWNVVLAQAMHRELRQTLKTEDRGKKIRHLAVLKTLNCPGVLVEPAFLTNDAEARKIATPAYQQQIAAAIARAVQSYSVTLDSLRPKSQPASATASPPTTTSSR